MREIFKFLFKIAAIALIFLITLFCIGLMANKFLLNDFTFNNKTLTNVGELAYGEETICKFADGFTSEGKTVPAGTVVKGPAFVKPDRDIDWGYPIYINETYQTKQSDEVVWLLKGDNACVDSQSFFFSFWGKNKP